MIGVPIDYRAARTGHPDAVAFDAAVDTITHTTLHLFEHLEVHSPPRSREDEKRKAQERGKKRDEQMRARVLRSLSS